MRLKLRITGFVQGVGLRPFIYRLAEDIGLKGYVLNDTTGVTIEVEGDRERLDDFLIRIEKEKPPLSRIYSLQHLFLEEIGFKGFEIRESKEEYNDPSNRRFHAQPNACHVCGPCVRLYDNNGKLICEKEDAISRVTTLINNGSIIALKGIGGYHLICDATNEEAVQRLRRRKHREEKPMATMFPDIDAIKAEAHVSFLEDRALNSVEKPIVILKKRKTTTIADSVSPDNNTVGAFLPYTPLHNIILQRLKKPVVATSANMTDEPIVKNEVDAFKRLSDIADYILSHNRDIVRRCDDSVVRIVADRQILIRRSRGFAPLPVPIFFKFKKPVLALGPYMNNTIAIGIDNNVFISQHIGDLDTVLAREFYEETINDFLKLFDIKPEIVVSDMHPGYYSTRFGERKFEEKLIKLQHHFAHILSCMAENEIPGNTEVIGFAFDGTGYGLDRTIWGGEVLIATYNGFKRVFHLRPYKLIGGEKAIKEPYRTAFSLLYETFGEKAKIADLIPIRQRERAFFFNMLRKNINSPVTTSMGRLFDGVSSIIGLKHKVSYHAQAAIVLEHLAINSDETCCYPFIVNNGVIDQRPAIEDLVGDIGRGVPKEAIAKRFHNTIVELIIHISEYIRKETGISTVALSGGVFQNAILLEDSFNRLKERGFTPLIHQCVPPNDGGISLGQAVYSHFAF